MTVAVVSLLALCDLRYKAVPAFGVILLAVLSLPDPSIGGMGAALAVSVFVSAFMEGFLGARVARWDHYTAAAIGLHLGVYAPLSIAVALTVACVTARMLPSRKVAVIPFLAAVLI